MKTPPTTDSGRRDHFRRAFSLTEVAISLGILAVAIIPLVGLLPVGLSNYRSAMDSMTRTAIARQVSSIVASQPAPASETLYFSDELAPLPGSGGAAYQVDLSVTGGDAVPSALDDGRTALGRLVRVSYNVHDAQNDRNLASDGFHLVLRD